MQLLSTVRMFTLWGTIFGTLLGAITGTLIFPFVGTIFASAWGFGIGLALGFVAGLLMVGFARIAPPRQCVKIIGGFAALGAPLLVVLTSEGILWNYVYHGYDYDRDVEIIVPQMTTPYLVPVLIAALVWGGLAAAYTAQRCLDWWQRLADERPPSERFGNFAAYYVETNSLRWWCEHLIRYGWWLLPLLGMIGLLVEQRSLYNSSSGLWSGALYAAIQVPLLALSNGLLLIFVNRIWFNQGLDDEVLPVYRRRIRLLTGIFTLVTGVFMIIGILAPLPGYLMVEFWSLTSLVAGLLLAGLAAALVAWQSGRYATWLMQAQERGAELAVRHKRKPKLKNEDTAEAWDNPFEPVHAARETRSHRLSGGQ